MDIVAVLLTILTISLQENINDLLFLGHRNQSDISLNQMRHETSKMLVIIL